MFFSLKDIVMCKVSLGLVRLQDVGRLEFSLSKITTHQSESIAGRQIILLATE